MSLNVNYNTNNDLFAFFYSDAKDAVRGLDGRMISGRRVRVELSTGKSARSAGRSRRGRSRGREDRCYECGKSGHFARDCRRRRRR